ncbi:hypothetical protein K437DRAFT_274891 [Tilletiaria anomala UBC 951]|uniref:CP-type G domain-containing protein n=1 Tax=Tilletiaria anomala (strain ATCC 24038 / CBS 436.72 / UBC 951) TaxID=1037660 RepID=A0A066VX82_TILAU|nr:uncharacterized protein K437DRAFT_274891 [Tilletiaria anomala UBC 951]KDN43414.1 hypothetical protein K437DRAFT_274891 [Tilletiaria anomala UBC 951]
MSGQRDAASKRKQQGRVNKLQGKSLVPGSNNGSRKDTGLPSFFKHRKQALATVAQQGGQQTNGKGKEKEKATAEGIEGDAMETDGAATHTLSEGVAKTQEEAGTGEDLSFTFSAASASNPFSSAAADPALTGQRDSSLRAYASQLRKLLTTSDILLEVLDARDPLSCRSYSTETLALGQGKRIILILNKIDLVPRENVEKWLKYLRHDFPTLAFKASTQMQRKNLAQGAGSVPLSNGSTAALTSGSEALGAQALLQLLKNYSRNHSLKSSLTVGVFGAPNVGKSSIINSLKRARVCAVASTPGHTKVLQSVALDKKIKLIDCPGIVFQERDGAGGSRTAAGGQQMDGMAAALRNVVKVELLQDPVSPIAVVLSRVPLSQLETLYSLPSTSSDHQPPPHEPMPAPSMDDVQSLLLRLALRKGRLLAKGGAPDIEGTARTVLHDWNTGKIKYATQPPAVHRSAVLSSTKANTINKAGLNMKDSVNAEITKTKEQLESEAATAAIAATTSIKTSFDAEFDLAGLLGEADAEALMGAGSEVNAVASEMGTFETPQTVLSGRGSLADSDGKALLQAREPKFVGAEQPDIATKEQAMLLADTSNQTIKSLGKRRRRPDDDANILADSDDAGDPRTESDSDSDDDGPSGGPFRAELIPPRKQVRIDPTATLQHAAVANTEPAEAEDLPSWLERQRSKASSERKSKKDTGPQAEAKQTGKLALLSTVFSPSELENMAVSRGSARKKAKKQKRRAEKGSAGGLTDIMETAMDLVEDADDDAFIAQDVDEDVDFLADPTGKQDEAAKVITQLPKQPAHAMVDFNAGDESEEEL